KRQISISVVRRRSSSGGQRSPDRRVRSDSVVSRAAGARAAHAAYSALTTLTVTQYQPRLAHRNNCVQNPDEWRREGWSQLRRDSIREVSRQRVPWFVAQQTAFRKRPDSHRSRQSTKSSSFVLVLIGVFKLLKALLLIAVGIGAIKFLHKDIGASV